MMKQNLFNCWYFILAGILMLIVNFWVYAEPKMLVSLFGGGMILVFAGMLVLQTTYWKNKNYQPVGLRESVVMILIFIGLSLLNYWLGWSINDFTALLTLIIIGYYLIQIYFWFHNQKA